jgi:hypothetical protein
MTFERLIKEFGFQVSEISFISDQKIKQNHTSTLPNQFD